MTAVTTAGLLAGLFGSAFVPAVRAAQTATATVTGGDRIASTVMYTSTATYPVVTVTIAAADGTNDDGTWGISFSGGTVRGCATTGATATMTSLIGSTSGCSATVAVTTAPENIIFVATLEKLAAGASATLTVSGPSASVTVTPNVTTITGQASTALAANINASKSAAAILWNTDGDTTGGEVDHDVADTTISSVKYFAPTQSAKKAIIVGQLKNGYDVALATGTFNLVAEVTAPYTVGCETDATYDSAFTDSAASLQSFSVVAGTSPKWECQVFSDSKTAGNTAGGAWTFTLKTDSGSVVGTANGGFLGKVTALAISAPYGTLIATAAADVATWVKVVATDAAGRTWPQALTSTIASPDADAVVSGVATDLEATLAGSATYGATATLDNSVICPSGAEDTTVTDYKINIPAYVGASTTVVSNGLTFTCGADAGATLYVKSFKFSKSDPNPGEVIELHTYMEDVYGSPAGAGDLGGEVDMTLTNGTALYALNRLGAAVGAGAALDGGDTVDADSFITGDGYFAMEVKASTTIGAAVTIVEPGTSLIVKAYVVSDSFANTLAAGPKKLVATANFGPAAARRKVAFVLESTSGVTKTFYRRANASGVATYSLVPRGTWTVYATYGDEITETVTLKK